MNEPETTSLNSSLVEKAYQEALDCMGGPGRVRRTCQLYQSFVRMLRHQLGREFPDLSEHDLKIKVAEILYLSDAGAQELLRRAKQ